MKCVFSLCTVPYGTFITSGMYYDTNTQGGGLDYPECNGSIADILMGPQKG